MASESEGSGEAREVPGETPVSEVVVGGTENTSAVPAPGAEEKKEPAGIAEHVKVETENRAPAKAERVQLDVPSGKEVIITLHLSEKQALMVLSSTLHGAPVVGPRKLAIEDLGENLRSALDRYRFEVEKFRLEQKAKDEKKKRKAQQKGPAAAAVPARAVAAGEPAPASAQGAAVSTPMSQTAAAVPTDTNAGQSTLF